MASRDQEKVVSVTKVRLFVLGHSWGKLRGPRAITLSGVPWVLKSNHFPSLVPLLTHPTTALVFRVHNRLPGKARAETGKGVAAFDLTRPWSVTHSLDSLAGPIPDGGMPELTWKQHKPERKAEARLKVNSHSTGYKVMSWSRW